MILSASGRKADIEIRDKHIFASQHLLHCAPHHISLGVQTCAIPAIARLESTGLMPAACNR
jgi:hypothetical protein